MAAFIGGANNRAHAPTGTTQNALGVINYEEQSAGSPAGTGVGMGVRLAVRDYNTFPADVFKPGSDTLAFFNGGRMIVTSVSGGYTTASVAAGTHDTEWNSCLDRMYALPFDATDSSGFGTKKPPIAPLCLFHEVNVPKHNQDPVAYVAAVKHLRVLRNARALAAGVDALRVPIMTIYTAFGINQGQATPFWPGNDQVDIFGVDGYSGLGSPPGPWTEPAAVFGGTLKFAAAHGDKDIWICETSVRAEAGHSVTSWWANYQTFVLANPKIRALLAFEGAPGDTTVNWDHVGNPDKHEGLRQFFIGVGATAGFGVGGTQLPPSGPTGLVFVSDLDGRAGTLTWSANAGGDNVTGWNVFQAAGKVTSGFSKITPTTLAVSPRSLRITGLTPGTLYTFTMTATNSAATSGFGFMLQTQTSTPGPTNRAPTIVSFTATVDGTDPTLVHFASVATDPDIGDTLTYTISVVGLPPFTDTQIGPNVDANYPAGEAYVATLAVSDGQLTVTQDAPFSIADGPPSTPDSHYEIPLAGDDIRQLNRIYRNTIPDIDARTSRLERTRSPGASLQRFVATTFDSIHASGTAKTAFAVGDVRWYPMLLQGDVITGICTYVSDVQLGTGSAFCVLDADGVQLCNVQSGVAVDSVLQTAGGAVGNSIDLDLPITTASRGDIVYVGYYLGAAVTTPFKTYVSTGVDAMGQIRLTQGHWRGNKVASQSAFPDVLPFASAVVATPAFFALYDDS